MTNFDIVHSAWNNICPTNMEKADFLDLNSSDVKSKLVTIKNKINWLERFIKPLGLVVKIEKK